MYKFLLGVMCVLSLNAEMVGGVAVVVKDKAITLYDIEKEQKLSRVDVVTARNILIRKKLEEIEIEKRKISVDASEVYADIKQTAKRQNMSVNEFYEFALNSNGLNSADLKEKVKHKLLAQRLHSAIAYTKISQPTDEEIQEYYELNKKKFTHPQSFNTIIYQAKDRNILLEKIQNPMFYSPQVQTTEQVLAYNRISPELATLLKNTPVNSFTPIIPDGQGGNMSFYLKEVVGGDTGGIDSMKNQISNEIVSRKREQVLGDYFLRLQDNTDIKILRTSK